MTAGQETPKTEDRDGRSPEGTLEVQAIDALVRRLMRAASVVEEEAEQVLHAHEGDYDAAYSQLEEEAQHGQEGGGCYGWVIRCNDCQAEDESIRELRQAEVEEDREYWGRERERQEEEDARSY